MSLPQLVGWVVVAVVCLPACTPLQMVFRNLPETTDYRRFPQLVAQPSSQPFRFHYSPQGLAWQQHVNGLEICVRNEVLPIEQMLRKVKSTALLIIQRDTVMYEQYFNGHRPEDFVTSFSVSKAFVGTLLGIAIQEGLIQGMEQPVTDFLPELASRGFDDVRIKHLANMCSGLHYGNGTVRFFLEAGKVYYTPNLRRHIAHTRAPTPAGTEFAYLNTNTEILAMVLEKATGKRLHEYFEEKLWQLIGTEQPLIWSADNRTVSALPKAFCCMNALAHDFAKYGRLYQNIGNWNGRQVVDSAWVMKSFGYDTDNECRPRYRMHWLNRLRNYGVHFTAGLYGQYVIVIPDLQITLVHFADKNVLDDDEWMHIVDQITFALPPMQGRPRPQSAELGQCLVREHPIE
jgi:CubicO group peptidase (beta-lactamase class C family)